MERIPHAGAAPHRPTLKPKSFRSSLSFPAGASWVSMVSLSIRPGSFSQVELGGLEPPTPLLAKEVAAAAVPVAVQVKSNAGCSVDDRESPWVALLTVTWGAWPWLVASALAGPVG